MFCVAKRRQTSKRKYFLTCHGVNPSKNTVYDALRPHARRIRLTACANYKYMFGPHRFFTSSVKHHYEPHIIINTVIKQSKMAI